MYDWNTTEGLGAFSNTVPAEYLPAKSQNWAYNVFGGGEVPHLVFVFSDITTTAGSGLSYTGKQYVTVKGFRDATTQNPLQSIENGKTYTFTDGITISEDNLTDTPEGDPANGTEPDVDVSETPWGDNSVQPIH
ncbi:MAG: hypothetical protein LUH04_01270 [Clostridium sp.]|nr:hypothetical protein [Clostridium sp.]